MDLLFKRYASPFSFINGMIQTGRLCEFVDDLLHIVHEEKEEETSWQYFLHKVFEGSYSDFKEELKQDKQHKTLNKQTIETTYNHSMNILKNFNPEKGGDP